MGKSAVLFVFSLVTLLSLETMAKCNTPACPDNQEYLTCGTACPKTCSEPNDRLCTLQCVSGCFCKAPRVLDEASGECVELEDCPTDNTPACPKNQEYLTCGSACPRTCSEPNARICTDQCVSGCFCKAPRVLDEASGECVEVEDCPADTTPACPNNQKFLSCGTACPKTCSEPNDRPCTRQCVRGCFCKAPKVLNEASGYCVELEYCPTDTTPACPHNQEYLTCGTACPETCKKTYNRPPICTLQCVSGCFCKAPKVLDEASGECVDKRDCPAGY